MATLKLEYQQDDYGSFAGLSFRRGWLSNSFRSGKAYFSYLLEYHFACSDMDSERTVEETVDFVVDEESAEVTFTFIDMTTRSTTTSL